MLARLALQAPMKSRLIQCPLLYSFLWQWFSLRHARVARDSRSWWQRTRNIHSGRRGFVIGNGPSLRIADLSRLRSEICIASNKIYLAFDETDWRPDYLTCIDKLVWEKIQGDLPGRFQEIIALSTLSIRHATIPVVVARHLGGHASVADGFSMDGTQGVFGGRTVTYTNLQLAAHLGLNPIYLLGCDHYYQGEAGAKASGAIIAHASGSNHFSPKYRTEGERVNSAPIKEMDAAFVVARRVAEKHGVRIYNATRGGHLEVFERASLDSIV